MQPLLLKTLKRLIFIPVCASCKDRLSPFSKNEEKMHGNICFCDKCLEEWERARAEACPICSQKACDCFCFSEAFKGQPSIPALCFYHPERHDAQSNAIITMKRVRDRELFAFMSKELAPQIEKTLSEMGVCAETCVFTWIPRKKQTISKTGFDQGRELCATIARELGGKVYPLFDRFGGKEQKKLDRRGRAKNAERSIVLNSSMSGFPIRCDAESIESFIKGRSVVVIDDVMTSGSTLKKSVSLLKEAEALQVIVSCIAKTAGSGKKNKKSR